MYPWISKVNKLDNALYCRKRKYSQEHTRKNFTFTYQLLSLGILVKKYPETRVSCDKHIEVLTALSSDSNALIYIQNLFWLLWHLLVPLAEFSSSCRMYRIVVTVPKCLSNSLFLSLLNDYIKQVWKPELFLNDIHSIPRHLLILAI